MSVDNGPIGYTEVDDTPIATQVAKELKGTLINPELLEKLNSLEGLTDSRSCQTLFHLATMVPVDQAIVELGVYAARSICWLAAGAREAGVEGGVWGIDLWDIHTNRVRHRRGTPAQNPVVRALAKRQLEFMGLTGMVKLRRDFTAGFADKYKAEGGAPIGLLYIDANHTKEAVLADFAAWWDHLADNAVIVFDDYCQGRPTSGDSDTMDWEYAKGRVRDAVHRLMNEKWIVDVVESDGRFAICRKGKGPNG